MGTDMTSDVTSECKWKVWHLCYIWDIKLIVKKGHKLIAKVLQKERKNFKNDRFN